MLVGLTFFACILIGISTVSGLILLYHDKLTLLNVLYVNSNDNLPKWYSSMLLALSSDRIVPRAPVSQSSAHLLLAAHSAARVFLV